MSLLTKMDHGRPSQGPQSHTEPSPPPREAKEEHRWGQKTKKNKLQRGGIEPPTSAVLKPRHNQLDHLCVPTARCAAIYCSCKGSPSPRFRGSQPSTRRTPECIHPIHRPLPFGPSPITSDRQPQRPRHRQGTHSEEHIHIPAHGFSPQPLNQHSSNQPPRRNRSICPG